MKIKNFVLTLAALSGFFISQNVQATCSNYNTFVDGTILTASQLNNLQTNYTNCINDLLDGDSFTGDINLFSGADLSLYSDEGDTLKFRIDGSTGLTSIFGADADTDTALASNDVSLVLQNNDTSDGNYASIDFKNNTEALVSRIASVNSDDGVGTEYSYTSFLNMYGGSFEESFRILPEGIALPDIKYLCFGAVNNADCDTSIRESAVDTIAFKVGGNDRVKIHTNGEIEATRVDPPTANYMNPNGVAKAWGSVADTNGSLVSSYNASFGSYSSGSTVINIGTDFSSSTSYAITITPRCGFDVNWRITAKSAGSFTVQTNTVSSGTGTNCGFDFTAIGTQ